MKSVLNALTLLVVILSIIQASAQKNPVAEINRVITEADARAHLAFLAADEMRGRDTGSPELRIAGNYLASTFSRYGLKTVPGLSNYFQPVQLEKRTPATSATVQIGEDKFVNRENLVVIDGNDLTWSGDFIYAGYGSSEELEKLNVKGKMVLALAGSRESDNINRVLSASTSKLGEAKRLGATGLVEILTTSQVPFQALVNFFAGGTRWGLEQEGAVIPHIWIKPEDVKNISYKENQQISGSLSVSGSAREQVVGRNVAALIAGTDSKLKDEYVIITAHYDHIGVGRPDSNGDSIFNGARDNAIGTVALLQTAKYLAQYPPKRSVILLALTSEEKGLLGSRWYADHPLVPLEKHVLNINCDGVGYNDTSIITSISLGRTSADATLQKAVKAFGLGLGGDPDPKEGFYERSDQVSFASKGIPAIKLQPGLAKMDDEIRKYYHRQPDEVSSLDFNYLTTFYRTFVYAVVLLANEGTPPFWVKGDKFEETGKKLYGKN